MVSPARAGMDLLESLICRFLFRFPRTRGDGPRDPEVRYERPEFPPHARGWTALRGRPAAWRRASPARAGMDLFQRPKTLDMKRFPRTRGDGPAPEIPN